MNYPESDQKLFKTHKNFYQVVTSRISDDRYDIQDGGMHNSFVLNKARYLVYQKWY